MILRLAIAAAVVGATAFVSYHLGRWTERARARRRATELERQAYAALDAMIAEAERDTLELYPFRPVVADDARCNARGGSC